MRVGEEIRRRRKERGLSQEALAAAMDVTRQAVTRWESGAAVPSSANLIRLSQVLELPLEELTGTPESAAAQLLARQEQRRNRRMELLTLAGKTALFYGILALFCWAGDTLLGWRVYPWFYL